MNFSKVKEWFIPEGKVKSVSIDGVVVWKAKDNLEQLTAPTISLDGDALTITATDDRTEEFVIFVGGVEMATVENEKEPETPQIITFTINDTPYQAVDGMTWGEWVESEYNTGGFYFGFVSGWRDCVINGDQEDGVNKGVTLNDKLLHECREIQIIDNAAYTLEIADHAGGGN